MKANARLKRISDEINEHRIHMEAHIRTAIQHAMEAGRLLTEAKALVAHGDWEQWLEANFVGSPRTARRWMQLHRGLAELSSKSATVAGLGIGEAMMMLAEPHLSEEEARALEACEETIGRGLAEATKVLDALKRARELVGDEAFEGRFGDLGELDRGVSR